MKDHNENDPNENRPVWELLNNASKTELSPFFARNVMREIRLFEDQKANGGLINGVFAFLKQRPVIVGLSAAAACVVLIFSAIHFQNSVDIAGDSIAVATPVDIAIRKTDIALAGEIEAVEYLGQLMAINDPGQLSDDALVDLLF